MAFISFIFYFYKYILSPLFHTLGMQFFARPGCRYYPSCSLYVFQAFKTHGMLGGSMKGIKRISSCNLFHRGGYDPV